jgi:hypothetical protein
MPQDSFQRLHLKYQSSLVLYGLKQKLMRITSIYENTPKTRGPPLGSTRNFGFDSFLGMWEVR